MNLTTIIYLVDVGANVKVLTGIAGWASAAIIAVLAVARVIGGSEGMSAETSRNFWLCIRALIPLALAGMILSMAIPSREALYAMFLSERAQGMPSSPALDRWLQQHVGGKQ